MVEIDHSRFVYYRKSIQSNLFDAIKSRLIKLGVDEKHILNEEATIHAQISDYVAFVNDIRQPPKLLLEEVIGTRDNDPNTPYSHQISTKTILEVDLFDC